MPDYAVEDTSVEGFPAKKLRSASGELEATFVPSVGMIGCSLRHRGEELLGQRNGLGRYAESGSTMGIPLLYPWANRLNGMRYEAAGRIVELDAASPLIRRDANGLPIHGLLSASRHWRVAAAEANGERARLRAELSFGARPELLAAFPFPHDVALEVALRRSSVSITTTVRPTSDSPVPISFGFHPYFRLPGVPRGEWIVHLPVRRELLVDGRGIPTGEGKDVRIAPGALGDRTYDTGYASLDDPARFVLEGGGRRLAVRFVEGYPFAQVYAPAGAELISYEPMTAPTNALASGRDLPLVAPGAEYRATFTIDVES
jgi:galactose mutarotase-like enzyme